MARKGKSHSKPHIQEQCGVWLSAKGRSKLQVRPKERKEKIKMVDCISTTLQDNHNNRCLDRKLNNIPYSLA